MHPPGQRKVLGHKLSGKVLSAPQAPKKVHPRQSKKSEFRAHFGGRARFGAWEFLI